MSVPEYKLEDIINNAIGDKPVMVQKAFDNVIVQRAADIIAGKRDEIASQYSTGVEKAAPEDSSEDDDLMLDDISDEELDDVLKDLDLDDEDYELDDGEVEDNDLDYEDESEEMEEPEEQ